MADACGQIVRSLAGHDKGALFCVLDTDGGYLLLCDGKRRRLERPKRKKEKHTQLLGTLPQPRLAEFQAGISSGQAGTYPTETYGGRWPLSELRN